MLFWYTIHQRPIKQQVGCLSTHAAAGRDQEVSRNDQLANDRCRWPACRNVVLRKPCMKHNVRGARRMGKDPQSRFRRRAGQMWGRL